MVKITFQPMEEIIIHDSTQHTKDELIRLQSMGVPSGGLTLPLNWAEGVVFIHGYLPVTEEVVRENLKGKFHWGFVLWALMPKYQEVIRIKQTNVKIPINNVSANKNLSEVAKSLKKKAKKITK